MKLGVTVIDKNNKDLEPNLGILLDDTVNQLKDQLFLSDEDNAVMYYPNLVKVQIENIVVSDTNNTILSFISNIETNKTNRIEEINAYVSSLFNIIDQTEYKGFPLETYDLYLKLKSEDNSIQQLYELLLREFVELKNIDLEMLIKIKMLSLVSNEPNTYGNVISESEIEIINEEWETYSNSMNEMWEAKRPNYLNEKRITEKFNQYAYELTDYSKYYEVESETGKPNFLYTNVTFHMKYKDKEYKEYKEDKEHKEDNEEKNKGIKTETEKLGSKFIKLSHVFNTFELTNDIPFIAFNDTPKRDPKVKIFNRLIDTLSEQAIKSWILNEKRGELSYKKVRGIMLKYKIPELKSTRSQNDYITVTINESGYFIVKISFTEEDSQNSIEKITDIAKGCINNIITILNGMYNIFLHSKRLKPISEMDVLIHSINSTISTNFLINKTRFRKMFTKFEISRLFEDKDISTKDKRLDMISMYYKRIGKRDTEEGESERLGITVNVKDNPFKLKSSSITIYDGYSLLQSEVILNHIIITTLLTEKKDTGFELESEEESDQVLKERSNTKSVRSKGGKIFSSKCQKPRQPIIDDNLQVEPFRVLEYESNRYICPGDKWKYPGFTSDNRVCCYDEEGKGMVKMLSTKILETRVQPSNFIVNIKGEGTSFDTYVIKNLSDDSSDDNFYYLDRSNKDFPLIKINDQNIVQYVIDNQFRDNESIWLKEIQLSDLIMKPNKSNCGDQPDFQNEDITNIHSSCAIHSNARIFGYNNKSLPCCFDKPRAVYNVFKIADTQKNKKHILKTDKLLDAKRQGLLPKGLNTLFNELIRDNRHIQSNNESGGAFLRWGVYQNKLSFLNCIVECLSDRQDVRINNTSELKRILVNYLKESPAEFHALNNGNISFKYNTLDNYIRSINDETNIIHWSDIIDLVQTVIGCNIMIIDIPAIETQSTINYDYTNMKIVCNLNIKQTITKPFIVLIKKQKSFELVVQDSSVEWDPQNQKEKIDVKAKAVIRFVFYYGNNDTPKNNIINFLLDYYKSSCVKENKYPDNFEYDELYTIDQVTKVLKGTKHEILFQLINDFNKAILVVTKRGLCIPIKESGMSKILHWATLKNFVEKEKGLPIDQVQKLVAEYNKIPNVKQMRLLGITTTESNESNESKLVSTGLLTNFGEIIPVKGESIENESIENESIENNLKLLDIKYYYDIDSYLSGKNVLENEEVMWNKNINSFKNKIYEKKRDLAQTISKDQKIKDDIISIVKDTKRPRIQKITDITNILQQINKNEVDNESIFILKSISNDIINDNIENLLLNNMVISEVFNPSEITKRENESVWLNVDDIKKWLRNFTVVE